MQFTLGTMLCWVWKGVIGQHSDDYVKLLLLQHTVDHEHFFPTQRLAKVHLVQIIVGSSVAH